MDLSEMWCGGGNSIRKTEGRGEERYIFFDQRTLSFSKQTLAHGGENYS
jgi:hypothetical protein